MGKAPAFQFYVKDWLSDPQLGKCSSSTKGIWIDCLCYMWESSERGVLTGTKEDFIRMLRTTEHDFDKFLTEANRHKFCDVTNCHNDVTIVNRRMSREEKARENDKIRQQKHRKGISKESSHENVTLPSSSSSPSPTPKLEPHVSFDTGGKEGKKFSYPPNFEAWWQAYPKTRRKGKGDALKAWKQVHQAGSVPELEVLISTLKVQTQSWDWTKDGGQYVPLPGTYLRARRWEDEMNMTNPEGQEETEADRYRREHGLIRQ